MVVDSKMLRFVLLMIIIFKYTVFSKDAPNFIGKSFIIPDVSYVYVATFKTHNVTVRSTCRNIPDFVVSFGTPVTILPRYNNEILDSENPSGATILHADDDIVVFVSANLDGTSSTPIFPHDVLASDYIVMTSETLPRQRAHELKIMDSEGNTTFHLTFRYCPGNCSLPACATQNYTDAIPWLHNCTHMAIYSCPADLTGTPINGNNPMAVMISDGSESHQLPPPTTWGKYFIIPRLPVHFEQSVIIKFVAKDPDTNISLLCESDTSNSSTNINHSLQHTGDSFTERIDSKTDCSLISNHPVLGLHMISGEGKGMSFIFPSEQFAPEYILPVAKLCGNSRFQDVEKHLVVIIETEHVPGLRLNGSHLSKETQQHQIRNTNYSRLFLMIEFQTLIVLRHTQPNVVFGASLICSTYISLTIPLGSRMAPIAEPCIISQGVPGDGLDNDCDGLIDEDICSSNFDGKDCTITIKDEIPCVGYTDFDGVTWKTTSVNSYDYQTCGTGKGVTSNFCGLAEDFVGVWQGPDKSLCVNRLLSDIVAKFTMSTSTNDSLADILHQAWDVIDRLINNHTFSAGELKTVVGGLDSVVDIFRSKSINTDVSVLKRNNFLDILNRILSTDTIDTWSILHNKVGINYASVIMDLVPRFGQAISNSFSDGYDIVRQNFIIKGMRRGINDVLFPNGSITSNTSSNDSIVNAQLLLNKETILNSLSGSIDYTAIYYRTLSLFLPNMNTSNIGSDIVSFSLLEGHNTENLDPPGNGTNSTCVFWDFNGSTDGEWSSSGCYAVYRNNSFTSCRCNHLTNFAVLLSSASFSKQDEIALTIITWPGCVVSIISLIITLCLYVYSWRIVKSDKSKLLICLCTVFILAYTLLLAGLNQTNDKTTCTAIAIVLHYLFLCAVFIMSAEGFEIALTIFTAYSQRKSHAVKLLFFSLVPPAIIVIISAVSTDLNGYGTDKYCWLDASNGLMYAFLVPCLVSVLVNIVITVLVVRKMFSTKMMMKKDTKDKVIAGARSIAVLAPILGLTWLFGILAFHRNMIVFSYLFAIFNSFQGLFILIFHGIMNVKIRQDVQKSWGRFILKHNIGKGRRKGDAETRTDTTGLNSTNGTQGNSTL